MSINLETLLQDRNFFNATQLAEEDTPNYQPEGLVKNPFYVGLVGKNVKSNLSEMSDKDLYSQFKKAVAMCRKNNFTTFQFNMNEIYSKHVTEEVLKNLTEYFTLTSVSIKLLKNDFHKQTSNLVSRNVLKNFNHSNIYLDADEIVIPLYELTEKDVKNYTSLYESTISLDKVFSLNDVLEHYENENSVYKTMVNDRLCKMFNDTKDLYWTNKYFCDINISDAFEKRTFKLKEDLDPKLQAIINHNKNVHDPSIQKVFADSKAATYDIQTIVYRKPEFIDNSKAIKNNKKYALYKMDNTPLDITKKMVANLFESITDEKLLFTTFNSFLLSKNYCHLVLNNEKVLDKMSNIFNSRLLVAYSYLFAYGWTTLYMEECIVKTRTLKENRYVFDINTASKLPFFPFCSDNIHLNPYCTLNVSKTVLNSSTNYHGIPMIQNYDHYGIDDLAGFRRKFNIFTTGNPDKNIFDGLETIEGTDIWKEFAVSGSVIPACTLKRNPLIDQVTSSNMSETDKLLRYFDEYYGSSDVDFMCNSKSVFDYMDNINNLKDIISKNLTELNNKPVTVDVEPLKTICIVVHQKYIEMCMSDLGDVENVIKNINTPAVKERFYEEYFTCKREKNKLHRATRHGNPLYEQFYKIVNVDDINVMVSAYETTKENQYESDADTYVYLNDVQKEKVPKSENILLLKVCESVKFKLSSPHMLHTIEAFRTRYDDFFSCVAKFHLPCVRGYYNGNTLYMQPSCVTALMTFTNIDYKYFAGIRDPIDIINKYRMRGFGTMINETEKKYVTEYNSSVDKWKIMYAVDKTKKDTVSKQFGPKKLNDNIYKPNKLLKSYPDDTYSNVNHNYIITESDLANYYKTKYNYNPTSGLINFDKVKAFKQDGSLEPVTKWLLDAMYDELK